MLGCRQKENASALALARGLAAGGLKEVNVSAELEKIELGSIPFEGVPEAEIPRRTESWYECLAPPA